MRMKKIHKSNKYRYPRKMKKRYKKYTGHNPPVFSFSKSIDIQEYRKNAEKFLKELGIKIIPINIKAENES